MSKLPPDWRARTLAMIRGAEPLDGRFFAGSDTLSPDQQLAVYRDQFRLRIPSALQQDAPGLYHLLGEQADGTFERYLLACPPHSWSLDHLGDHLEAWLKQQGAPTEQVEMARLDQAVQRLFFAREPVPLRPEELASMPALVASSAVELLTLQSSVHHYRSQALTGAEPAPLTSAPFYLLLHRKERRVRHLEVHPACYRLLECVHLGLEQAMDVVLQEQLIELQDLSGKVGPWFQLFASRGLVELQPDT